MKQSRPRSRPRTGSRWPPPSSWPVSPASFAAVPAQEQPFKPTWNSLKNIRTPQWLRDGKFGIYTHWGVYSVPAQGPNATWFANKAYWGADSAERKYWEQTWGPIQKFGYKDFIPMFTGEKFDADAWADLFQKAGARFAGPVAEHHDGFSMWDSKLSEWNAAKMGPKRDILGELAKADQEARHEVRRGLPPRRGVGLLPDLRREPRLRRPALLRPLRAHPPEGRAADEGLPRPVGGQGGRGHRQVRSGPDLVRQRPGADPRLDQDGRPGPLLQQGRGAQEGGRRHLQAARPLPRRRACSTSSGARRPT